MNRYFSLVAGAALVCAAPLHAQDVRSGIEAWQRGEHKAAIAIWRPLAAKGDADAAFNLGQAYRLGKGAPVDLARAQGLFEQAAQRGHLGATTVLGILLFQNGNRSAALRWLRKAAEGGEAEAMLLYGTALYNGDGVARDPVTAYAYVSRASAQGLAAATASLADLDEALSLDQRQKGVALARTMAGQRKAAATPAPKTARRPPAPRAAAGATAPAAAEGGWRIQLGAFGRKSSAEALFAKLGDKLGGRTAHYVAAGQMVRLQVGPFESRAAAASACARLAGQACFPVAPL